MVWQSRSINLSRSDTYFSFNSVFAGANKFDYLDPGVKMHPTKTFVFAGAPRPRMTKKRKPRGDTVLILPQAGSPDLFPKHRV